MSFGFEPSQLLHRAEPEPTLPDGAVIPDAQTLPQRRPGALAASVAYAARAAIDAREAPTTLQRQHDGPQPDMQAEHDAAEELLAGAAEGTLTLATHGSERVWRGGPPSPPSTLDRWIPSPRQATAASPTPPLLLAQPKPQWQQRMLAAWEGTVQDVQHWEQLPGDTFLARCEHVVAQDGRAELLLFILTIILALIVVVALCTRAMRRRSQALQGGSNGGSTFLLATTGGDGSMSLSDLLSTFSGGGARARTILL